MKKYLFFGSILAVVFWTLNPGMDDFKTHMETYTAERVERETGGGMLGNVLGGAASAVVSSGVGRVTERGDYVVFSTYDVDPDSDGTAEYRFLGVANQFFVLREPE